jgi:bifunctional non-homologous end joining protein LigD
LRTKAGIISDHIVGPRVMAFQPKKPAAIGVKALFPNFIKPCQPSRVARPPSGPLWVREMKHDGYRLMVRRDGARVRSRNGHDWADRFL